MLNSLTNTLKWHVWSTLYRFTYMQRDLTKPTPSTQDATHGVAETLGKGTQTLVSTHVQTNTHTREHIHTSTSTDTCIYTHIHEYLQQGMYYIVYGHTCVDEYCLCVLFV